MTRRAAFVAVVALVVAAPVLAAAGAQTFGNTEPLAAKQWYLEQDHAWESWAYPPQLPEVKVAVIDSGIDAHHPEFVGQIAAGHSFVPGVSWRVDTDGHGTFVAGLIAANPFNGVGIAGLGFNVKLLIAKVVDSSGAVLSLTAETDAIYWAVAQGARVINLSLGGLRDPGDSMLDSYSALERKAIEYATSKGVLVVAAVGNGTEAPRIPWGYADYPAALPHVLGVAALRQDGSVPDYSDRDPIYVDMAAPGDGIFSTLARNLIDKTRPECAGDAYSECGPPEFHEGIGTSFAAPQVAAAAALLFGVDPTLTPDQVQWVLERFAKDVSPLNGCPRCLYGRDAMTGWGRLDVAAAVRMVTKHTGLPTPDAFEPNDDAGSGVAGAHPFGPPGTITASLDYWDDPIDVYSVRLTKGEAFYARLSGIAHATTSLILWDPATGGLEGVRAKTGRLVSASAVVGIQQRLSYRAGVAGIYYLQVTVGTPPRIRGVMPYHLSVATEPAAPAAKK
ncbi:MAG: S8 family serine peptidase [Actinomycetes bacterium]